VGFSISLTILQSRGSQEKPGYPDRTHLHIHVTALNEARV